jgi:hypothetical protein
MVNLATQVLQRIGDKNEFVNKSEFYTNLLYESLSCFEIKTDSSSTSTREDAEKNLYSRYMFLIKQTYFLYVINEMKTKNINVTDLLRMVSPSIITEITMITYNDNLRTIIDAFKDKLFISQSVATLYNDLFVILLEKLFITVESIFDTLSIVANNLFTIKHGVDTKTFFSISTQTNKQVHMQQYARVDYMYKSGFLLYSQLMQNPVLYLTYSGGEKKNINKHFLYGNTLPLLISRLQMLENYRIETRIQYQLAMSDSRVRNTYQGTNIDEFSNDHLKLNISTESFLEYVSGTFVPSFCDKLSENNEMLNDIIDPHESHPIDIISLRYILQCMLSSIKEYIRDKTHTTNPRKNPRTYIEAFKTYRTHIHDAYAKSYIQKYILFVERMVYSHDDKYNKLTKKIYDAKQTSTITRLCEDRYNIQKKFNANIIHYSRRIHEGIFKLFDLHTELCYESFLTHQIQNIQNMKQINKTQDQDNIYEVTPVSLHNLGKGYILQSLELLETQFTSQRSITINQDHFYRLLECFRLIKLHMNDVIKEVTLYLPLCTKSVTVNDVIHYENFFLSIYDLHSYNLERKWNHWQMCLESLIKDTPDLLISFQDIFSSKNYETNMLQQKGNELYIVVREYKHELIEQVVTERFHIDVVCSMIRYFLFQTRSIKYTKDTIETPFPIKLIEDVRYRKMLLILHLYEEMNAKLRIHIQRKTKKPTKISGLPLTRLLEPIVEDLGWYFEEINNYKPTTLDFSRSTESTTCSIFHATSEPNVFPFIFIVLLVQHACMYFFNSRQGAEYFLKNTNKFCETIFTYSTNPKGRIMYFLYKYGQLSFYDQISKPSPTHNAHIINEKIQNFDASMNKHALDTMQISVPFNFQTTNRSYRQLNESTQDELNGYFYRSRIFLTRDEIPSKEILTSDFVQTVHGVSTTILTSRWVSIYFNELTQIPYLSTYDIIAYNAKYKTNLKDEVLIFDPLKNILESISPYLTGHEHKIIYKDFMLYKSKVKDAYGTQYFDDLLEFFNTVIPNKRKM